MASCDVNVKWSRIGAFKLCKSSYGMYKLLLYYGDNWLWTCDLKKICLYSIIIVCKSTHTRASTSEDKNVDDGARWNIESHLPHTGSVNSYDYSYRTYNVEQLSRSSATGITTTLSTAVATIVVIPQTGLPLFFGIIIIYCIVNFTVITFMILVPSTILITSLDTTARTTRSPRSFFSSVVQFGTMSNSLTLCFMPR